MDRRSEVPEGKELHAADVEVHQDIPEVLEPRQDAAKVRMRVEPRIPFHGKKPEVEVEEVLEYIPVVSHNHEEEENKEAKWVKIITGKQAENLSTADFYDLVFHHKVKREVEPANIRER